MKKTMFLLSLLTLCGVAFADADSVPVVDSAAEIRHPIGSQAAKVAERKKEEGLVYKSLTTVVKGYLDGHVDEAKKNAAKVAKVLKADDPFMKGAKLIAGYLGGENVSESKLFLAVKDNDDLAALAFLSMFVRKIAAGQNTDKPALSSHLDNYARMAKSGKNRDVSRWTKRVSAWKEWVMADYSRKPGLERLLEKMSGFEKLADVPKVDFIQHHSALTRPSFDLINFDKTAAADYVRGLTDIHLKRAENRRLACITNVKEYVIALLSRNSFEGRIYLKKSPAFNGTIVRANENQVIVRKGRSSSAKGTSYQWEDFRPEQFAEVVESFAKRRQAASTRAGEGKQKLDAGEDLVIASVLYLFSGLPDRAYEAAVDAEKLSPTIQKKVKRIFCDSLPSDEEDKENGENS